MVSFSSAVRRLSPVKARKAVLWCFVGGMSAILASSWVNQNTADTSVSQVQVVPIQFDENLDHEAALSTHYPSTDPFFDSVKPSPFPFAQEIREISERFELSHSLIFAVAKTESGFRTQVESGAGAVGVMQVIAHAAGQDAWQRVLKKKGQPSLRDLKDPYTNMLLGSAYLKLLQDRYFNDIEDPQLRLGVVLAAYNWGPTNVRSMLDKGRPDNLKELYWMLWTYAPRETYGYVRKVVRTKAQFEAEHHSSFAA